jgi:hypothetical protein
MAVRGCLRPHVCLTTTLLSFLLVLFLLAPTTTDAAAPVPVAVAPTAAAVPVVRAATTVPNATTPASPAAQQLPGWKTASATNGTVIVKVIGDPGVVVVNGSVRSNATVVGGVNGLKDNDTVPVVNGTAVSSGRVSVERVPASAGGNANSANGSVVGQNGPVPTNGTSKRFVVTVVSVPAQPASGGAGSRTEPPVTTESPEKVAEQPKTPMSTGLILGIAAGASVAVFLPLLLCFCCGCIRCAPTDNEDSDATAEAELAGKSFDGKSDGSQRRRSSHRSSTGSQSGRIVVDVRNSEWGNAGSGRASSGGRYHSEDGYSQSS